MHTTLFAYAMSLFILVCYILNSLNITTFYFCRLYFNGMEYLGLILIENHNLDLFCVIFQPIIGNDLVDEHKEQIADLIRQQRIGPEHRVRDFDNYVCLLNGKVSSKIYKIKRRNNLGTNNF